MIPEWLPLAVALLLALVWNVLVLILSALLLLGGPIMIVVAWSAMARRLDCERPATRLAGTLEQAVAVSTAVLLQYIRPR